MNILVLNLLQKIRNTINNYLFEDKHLGTPLFTLRIGLGIIVLLQLIHLMPDAFTLIGKNGMIHQDIANIQLPQNMISSDKLVDFLSYRFHFSEFESLYLLGWIYCISALFLIVGLFTRFSATVCWLLHLAFVNSGHFFTYGVDYFITMLLFYCIIFPVGYEFSVDNYLFRYRHTNYTPYIRVLQIHLCIVYFVSGLAKTIGINWWNGVSILKALCRPGISSFHIQTFSKFSGIFVLIGVATIILELLYVVFVNYGRTRKLWLFLTCVMHIVIAFCLQLPFFAAVMILMNVCAFYFPTRILNSNSQNDNF